ncbi:hypothetical protein [Devosia sp.]|uniref:hypothetical protein n=1 Tax=Devosia sp. TaxID=1871048 RepID=UPI0032662A4C
MTPMPGKFPGRSYWFVLAGVVVFAVLQLVAIGLLGTLMAPSGLPIDTADINPCMIWACEWSQMPHFGGILDWFLLLTLPFLGGAAALLMIVLAIHYAIWTKRHRSSRK